MADVIAAVVPFTVPNTTGNVVVSSSRFAGKTPKAAILVCDQYPTTDPAQNGSILRSIGFAVNGGSQSVHNMYTQSNQNSTNTSRRWRSDRVVRVGGDAFELLLASASSWSANQLVLNFGNVQTFPCRCYAILLGGDDLIVSTGLVQLVGGQTVYSVASGLGASVDAVFVGSSHAPANSNSNVNGALWSFGIALSDGTQYCASYGEADAVSAGSQPRAVVRNDAVACALSLSGAADTYRVSAQNFAGATFELNITSGAAVANDRIGWLALHVAGTPMFLGDYTLPTATGIQSITAPGFTPQLGLICSTQLTAYNANAADNANAASLSIGAFGDDMAQAATVERVRFDADPTDTATACLPTALLCATATLTQAYIASLDAMTANGFDLDFSLAGAVAGIGFTWAIEVGDTPPGAPIADLAQGVTKFLVDTEGETDPRISQGVTKFLIDSGVAAEMRVAQSAVKFLVRTWPIHAIAKKVPPVRLTQNVAPYIRTKTEEG